MRMDRESRLGDSPRCHQIRPRFLPHAWGWPAVAAFLIFAEAYTIVRAGFNPLAMLLVAVVVLAAGLLGVTCVSCAWHLRGRGR
jgi:hypothetical protein